MILSRNMLKRVGESRHPCRTPTVVRNQSRNAAVEEDSTSGLAIEVFGNLDRAVADVVLLLSCPQSWMPNPVEGLLEVYKDMVEVLLVLEIFLTEDSRLKVFSVVLLPALKPACSSAMIFSACGFNLEVITTC